MRLRIGLLALTVTSAVAFASANAADMYVPGPAGPAGGYKDAPWVPSWSGFYVGVNGGGASSASDFAKSVTGFVVGNPVPVGSPPVNALDPSGAFGGGQIGYNWQGIWHPHLVLGVEADIQGAGINDKTFTTVPNFPGFQPFTYAQKYDLDYFGTVRGRIGYAFDRALLYATGGLAYGGVNYSAVYNVTPGPDTATLHKSAVETGYVVGGGIEYKLGPAWSLKGEYQYINLGKDSATGAFNNTPTAFVKTTFDNDFHTVRAGLNYHILPSYEPLK